MFLLPGLGREFFFIDPPVFSTYFSALANKFMRKYERNVKKYVGNMGRGNMFERSLKKLIEKKLKSSDGLSSANGQPHVLIVADVLMSHLEVSLFRNPLQPAHVYNCGVGPMFYFILSVRGEFTFNLRIFYSYPKEI